MHCLFLLFSFFLVFFFSYILPLETLSAVSGEPPPGAHVRGDMKRQHVFALLQ